MKTEGNLMNHITGRSAFLALLKDEGVTHLFGNPGTTELPVMDALKDHPDLTYVLGLQESLVVAMADGYARASGELVACNVHVAPGLGNALGSLFNAKFTGTPMILTAGQQELGHGLTEPLLYHPLVPMAEPLVKWAVEVPRLEDLPRIVRRAAKVAMTPPTGPVFISLPGDILNAEAGIDLGASSRVDTRVRPSNETLRTLAERLLKASKPVIIAGDELVKSDALKVAGQFASALGAPVYQQSAPYGAHFISTHPCYMGSLTRDQKRVRALLSDFDLMIVLLNDWDIAKNYAVEIGIKADLRETLGALVPVIDEVGGASHRDRAKAAIAALSKNNWTANRDVLAAKARDRQSVTPIDVDWLSLCVAEALPDNAVLVNEGLTSSRHLTDFAPYTDRYGFHGLASGGIGWSVPASVGIAMAQAPRPVCTVVGDGSAMYSIQALWTAAANKLPITYVICNNGGYRIIKQRLLSFHGNDHFIGMDFEDPPIDFVQMGQSMGIPSVRIEDPAALAPALKDAMRTPGPKLFDVIVDDKVG
jgi:benzoylformate decarboxylase